MSESNRKITLNIMTNLQLAHDEMRILPESYKRDEAYNLIEAAHQAVALLLVQRSS